MKDIPMFTTEYGVASLTLREIPYRQEAYVLLQATQQPEGLLSECICFCRACGAEKIYATGHEALEQYPLHTAIVRMSCEKNALPQTDAALFPVLPKTLKSWLKIYSEKMEDVPNAASMTSLDGMKMLEKGDGYFIHRDGELLGIGRASGDMINVVIAVKKGAGREVVSALASLLTEHTVNVEVATANIRAVKLYEKLGFLAVSQISSWYKIYE